MKTTKTIIRKFWLNIFTMFLLFSAVSAAPVVRQGAGANAAAIQGVVDQFRADLGGSNNGVGNHFTTGRREINWDGVPDNFAEPNNFPPNFFNVNSPRGVVLNALEFDTGTGLNQFAVSANSSNPTNTAAAFADINPTYAGIFQTFSPQRLFIARNTGNLEVNFFIPGTKIPATVSGFGAVFTDVDSASGGDRTIIRAYGVDGNLISAASAPASDNGLSFVGISFNAGERIARIVIESGNAGLSASNYDGVNGVDVVAMDDFVYGEPQATEYHASDFDGDGVADLAVFRPSIGTWFILNSGSNTFFGIQFGASGDVPIQGDFDGDSRNDIAVFRPSIGTWFMLKSSNGQFLGVQFGQNGDKPVPGDYDKDGKTDIAVWRPENGVYFRLNSSNGAFQAAQFGQINDAPVGASINP